MSLIQLDDLPFCAGCSHEQVFDALDAALERAGLGPDDVVVVSDIGCQGIADQRIGVDTFHGLHGRSFTYASGIKLARPDLKVVVLVGDGGCGIGGAHLINAARRNIGICVIVFDNFNFGMTGGQHSVTTPFGGRTTTTPEGNLERGFDLARLATAAGAGFAARMTATDPDLPDVIAQGIAHDGFALIDTWGICTAYFMKRNALKKAQLEERAHARPGYGVTWQDGARELSSSLRRGTARPPLLEDTLIPVTSASELDRRLGIVLAGSAGMKIGTAASLVTRAAVSSGLYATQKSIIPVTVTKGFSLAEVILSPEPIENLQVREPDLLVISSRDGLEKSKPLHDVAKRILIEPSLADEVARAEPLALPGVRKTELTLGMAAAALAGVVPDEAVFQAVERWGVADARARLRAAVEAGLSATRATARSRA
ncbi:MAG: thiamine pyrophosphate-dependent enzyme [Actinomycetota bacterium]